MTRTARPAFPPSRSRTPPPGAAHRLIAAVLVAFALQLPRAAAATTCTVDPTGTSGLPGTSASVNAALSLGGCGIPGSVIEIWCPAAGCSDSDVLDLVFGVDGSGRLTLDHTVVAGNWGKVLSMSSWYVAHGNTCPPITPIAASFWGNSVDADPAACLPSPMLRTTWNPRAKTSTSTPRTLTAYPDVVGPWSDLYLIRRRQPLPYALPTGLYLGRSWSVNGKQPDLVRLDIGYHNPL